MTVKENLPYYYGSGSSPMGEGRPRGESGGHPRGEGRSSDTGHLEAKELL